MFQHICCYLFLFETTEVAGKCLKQVTTMSQSSMSELTAKTYSVNGYILSGYTRQKCNGIFSTSICIFCYNFINKTFFYQKSF